MALGHLCLVLHAHLPFVRHPEHEDFLEEDWLFEAISETYLPLLELCERLLDARVGFRLGVSITPTLAAMLEDDLLRDRYVRHVSKLIELSAREVERTRWMPEIHLLAQRYHAEFTRCRLLFVEHHRRDLLAAFRRLAEAGAVELLTSGATHAFLPLMLRRKNLWRGQILTAVQEHERHFGRRPAGIWLPECGYDPGVESVLSEAGLAYFFSDAHGILHGSPRPRFGVHAPVVTPEGIAAFGRDLESSRQVWCAWMGYPGDFDYREFYRDVGWDLDYEYVRPFLHADGGRTNLGIKYHRITGATDAKDLYDPERARAKARLHADHFLEGRLRQVRELRGRMDAPPVIVAPYDAELFGHWWYEGPVWLESLLRRVAETPEIRAVTPSEHLAGCGTLQVSRPAYSSWGLRGYAEHWLDRSNDWLYPHLHLAGERMIELANRFRVLPRTVPAPNALADRALRQAARELLLAQSSDWAFILKAGTMTGYAERRSREHLGNFTRLYEELSRGAVDVGRLADLESRDNLFPRLDWRLFADEA
jgi:1,4-alpha-glucan branching enzyme